MLVIDEFRNFGDTYEMKVSKMVAMTDLKLSDQRSQVRRNRNHPCIILWSIGNEEGQIQNDFSGATLGACRKTKHHFIRVSPSFSDLFVFFFESTDHLA